MCHSQSVSLMRLQLHNTRLVSVRSPTSDTQQKHNHVISKLHLCLFERRKKKVPYYAKLTWPRVSWLSVNSLTVNFALKLFQVSQWWMGCTWQPRKLFLIRRLCFLFFYSVCSVCRLLVVSTYSCSSFPCHISSWYINISVLHRPHTTTGHVKHKQQKNNLIVLDSQLF